MEKKFTKLNLVQRDKKHLWHPLTQHKKTPDTLGIIKAQGAYLYDENGKSYIDAISSWYTAVYGHCHPYIIKKVQQQVAELNQIVFAGFTHPPAVELSEKLFAILPPNQQKMFFSDNGSTATEVGIKLALQYHYNQGEPKKNIIIAFEEAFHGDTFGAMSVSNLSVYHGAFKNMCIEVKRIAVPTQENIDILLKKLDTLIEQKNIAAFIYEPLIQGAAAMKMYSSKGLNKILEYCKSNQVITIADEVMTGFGKTGKYFASEYLNTYPDIICLSKALTAGIVPMGLTTCTQQIYQAFYDDDLTKAFFHGHTYSANPIACTVASAGIDLLVSNQIQDNIKNIMIYHQKMKNKFTSHPKITNVRTIGNIFAFDLNIKIERYGDLRNKIFNAFMEKGVFLRPLGQTIYICVPYILERKELDTLFNIIEDTIERL